MPTGNPISRSPCARLSGSFWLLVALLPVLPLPALLAAPARQPPGRVIITVVDENGVAVSGAQLTLVPAAGGKPVRAETDVAGRARFPALAPGMFGLSVEKAGFYPISNRELDLTSRRAFEITLAHQREYHERVEVHYTPPVIDPQQTAETQTLSARDVVKIPYSTNRDYRNVLPQIPGVTPGPDGQIHINGSSSTQIYQRLDGFNVSQPVTGLLDMRVSPDALRSIDVVGSRLPADLGKSSGEALDLDTGMGDDHLHFSATNFIPSVQTRNGLHIEAFTPRATLSGPIRKGKAWFYEAGQGEYDLNIVQELPSGANEAPSWRWNNLAKTQVNISAANQLTTSFLVNGFRSPHYGLDALDPLETTTNLTQTAWFASMKDQMSLTGGSLLQLGFGFDQYGSNDVPRGSLPYVIRPEGTSGNYFETTNSTARRFEAIANLWLAGFDWHGSHQLSFGADLDRVTYHQQLARGAILIYREDGTLDRRATFSGPPAYDRDNVETSGYAEDGWAPRSGLFVNAGLRFDWDEILRHPLLAPRLAASYMLTSDGKTKLTAGVGLAYPSANLAVVSLPLQGQRTDVFYGPDGVTPLGPPVVTTYSADPSSLDAPRFLNWSVGFERMLPGQTHLGIDYVGKRGANGFTYQNVGAGSAPGLPSGRFVLSDFRDDTYDAFRVTVRYPFHRGDMVMVSYTRSRAVTTAALASSLDSLLFSPQLPGPLPWDSPNRLLSWAWAPLPYKFEISYAVDWRSGYPFNVVDQDQNLIGPPGSHRFPDYFNLNLFLERRFRLFGHEWAIRGGFDNITNHQNPGTVINNIDSPRFLTLEGVQGRAFTGRIRFLGRK